MRSQCDGALQPPHLLPTREERGGGGKAEDWPAKGRPAGHAAARPGDSSTICQHREDASQRGPCKSHAGRRGSPHAPKERSCRRIPVRGQSQQGHRSTCASRRGGRVEGCATRNPSLWGPSPLSSLHLSPDLQKPELGAPGHRRFCSWVSAPLRGSTPALAG